MLKSRAFFLLPALGAGLLGAASAGAMQLAVDTTEDTPDAAADGVCADANGNCSLRAAVQEANAAAPEAVTIRIPAGIFELDVAGSGEDASATGDLDIAAEAIVRIQGTGESTVIDANGLDRAFDLLGDGSLELRGLVVQNGAPPALESGGGLRSAGVLRVRDVVFLDNTTALRGGGIHHGGPGAAEIDDCLFRGNRAQGPAADDGGGGIYNEGAAMAVSKSAFTENVADGASGSGGGILNDAGTLVVAKSTFTGNGSQRAGGGIESVAGSTTLDRVDMSGNQTGPAPGNGGGFHQTGSGTVAITRGLYEGNTAAEEGGAIWNGSGTLSLLGVRVTGNTASGDDADQGGGGLFNAGGVLMVEKSRIESNTADGTAGSGGGILTHGGTLVVVKSRIEGNDAVRAGGGIESADGDVDLDKVWLRDNQTGAGPGEGGGLHLTGTAEVNVLASKVQRNTAASEGGGLWNSATGTMTVSRTQVRDNVASGAAADNGGGGLFNAGGTLVVDQKSKVSGNAATGSAGSGGGILNDQGELTVTDSTVDRNTARRAGGGIEAVGDALETGSTSLLRVKLQRNSTVANSSNGGGLHLTGNGLVEIGDSKVLRNAAAAEGGGLWNSATGTMIVETTKIEKNEAPAGADVFNDGGTFTIDGVDVPDSNM